MDPERWKQVDDLLQSALARPEGEREVFLHQVCAGDDALECDVRSLLTSYQKAGNFLQTPAMEVAARALALNQGQELEKTIGSLTGRTISHYDIVDDCGGQQSPEDRSPPDVQSPQTKNATFNSRQQWWIYLTAAAFLAHVLFVTAFWFLGPESMGIQVRPTKREPVVSKVAKSSPAERAGIRQGDVLVRANDRPVSDINYWYWFFSNVESGRPIMLEAERGGEHVRAVLLLRPRPAQYWSTRAGIISLLWLGGRFIALTVAFIVALLRPRHLVAWIGALLLAIYSSAELVFNDGVNSMWRHSPLWFQLLLWAAHVVASLGWGVWFTFFALFPRASFHSRWVWTLVWTPAASGSLLVNYQVWHFIYGPEHMIPWGWMTPVLTSFWIAYVLSSFVMLAIKYRRLETETEKRRVRLFVVSLAFVSAIVLPATVYSEPELSTSPGASLFSSFPVRALAPLAYAAFPICFAYSIMRHRLFDIRIIIRQGIRYAVAKRLLVLAVPAIIAVFLADVYAHRDWRVDTIIQERGWIYLGLVGLAILAHVRRQRWLWSLDRHFFREQYNAQEILRSTLEKVRAASNLAGVAPLVVKEIGAAMHPSFCAVLEHRPPDTDYKAVSIFPDQFPPPALPADSKIVELAKLIAKPIQFAEQDNWLARQLAPSEIASLRRCGLELLAPVRNRDADALIVLGAKRSEEPYTSEDMRLVEDLTVGLGLLPSQRFQEKPEIELSKECPACRKCYDHGQEFCMQDGSRLRTNSFPRCFASRFRLEFRIGQGGMGLVYEATDLQLQRKVAVKLMEDWIKDPAALDRFRREAHVLASLRHPNVVTLFDAGVTLGEHPFLVMERLQGRTLREELNCRTQLPSAEVRSIVRQLCAALSAAHRRSLIHRDLKPENIFLCDEEAHRFVKILDFGLAKLFQESSASTQSVRFSTVAEHIAGTPAYMSPEVLSGAKTERGCDIWALAIITFEMLTGQRPSFAQDGALIHSSAEGLPEFWRDFFNRSLAHEPSHRPESVDAFLDRFERAGADVLPRM